ncbi:MAG: Gx transporter family protein, partial [Oscillospiraceae bacterium]
MTTKRLTRLALLTAVALVLGYVESFIPIAPGIPGVKLGLSNTVL